ncbi:MAG: cell division protein FtsZ [Methanobacteriota archaeon]|nr:MAG: cell division protein FtsZ [Euryarchaeota archaeon]
MREVRIAVVGVGGAGSNAISRLYNSGIKSATTIAVNTDALHLQQVAKAHKKVLIGKSITKGLGAGGEPSMARKCAEADYDLLKEAVSENELVFIAAGMGGGTGTGAAPIVARAAKESGAIVIGVVTYPFKLERSRIGKAVEGISKLSKECHTLIVIDNNKLLDIAPNLPIDKAFELADSIINRAVKGISDAIVMPSLIPMDYADLRAIVGKGGLAMISIGEGSGALKVEDAIKSTLNNPLLEVDYTGAHGALIHIDGGEDMTIGDAVKIAEGITGSFNENADVKLGARLNPSMENKILVTAIVVGVKSPHITGSGDKKEEDTLDLGAL